MFSSTILLVIFSAVVVKMLPTRTEREEARHMRETVNTIMASRNL